MSNRKEVSKIEKPKFLPSVDEVMTYNSFYHLHKKTKEGKNIVLRKNISMGGWFGHEAQDDELKPTPHDSWMRDGHDMAPFTAADLEEFRAMTDEQLLEIISKK